MSLSKKFALMLSLLFSLIFAIFFMLSFGSVAKNFESKLQEDAKSKSLSMALNLSSGGDIISLLNKNFDVNIFEKIVLKDAKNKILYENTNKISTNVTPAWFNSLIDIKSSQTKTDVPNIGTLIISSSVINANKQLYDIFKSFVLYFIGSMGATIALSYFLFRRVMESSNSYAVSFAIKDSGISTKSEELEAYKELSYTDEATGLKNRKYLIDKLPQHLKVDASYRGGINMLLSLSGVIDANEKLGRQKVDAIFLSLSFILKEVSNEFKDSIVSRINPTEFCLILPECKSQEALNIAKHIQKSFFDIVANASLNKAQTFVSIGIYEYLYSNSMSQLLSRTDNALAQAKFSNSKIHLEKSDTVVEVMGKEAWKMLISKAIEKHRFSFVASHVVNIESKKVLHNSLSINLMLDKNSSYSYSQFMAPAIGVGLYVGVYRTIVNMLFKNSDMILNTSVYSIKLPKEYLEDKDTFSCIEDLLEKNITSLAFRLIIELQSSLVYEDTKYIRKYIELFKDYNIKIGLCEFIDEYGDYGYIKELKPVYIKAEGEYFLTQNYQSFQNLRAITQKAGTLLVATGVDDINIVRELKSIGIDAIEGKAVDLF